MAALPTGITGTASNGHVEQALHAYVVHHTHWDREWWATYQDLRIKLVELIDALLATLDIDETFVNFLLDGQTIILRDYLEIRPENREKLCRYIREGRIQSGPWHILPDEFLVSGESHIRNLWLARRTGKELEIPLLEVGYIPDTFGHIAQMPQILRGFGIDSAFVWRGYGGSPHDVKGEFLWEAPDGSEVLTHWFPDGYYQMPFLHFDNPDRPWEDKLGRIHSAFSRLGERATTDLILMPYGGDHQPIDRRLAGKIAEANEDLGAKGDVRWARLDDYLAAIRELRPHLETVRGELRAAGAESPHVLPGVLSARMYLKIRNFAGQTWLERYAEPLSALAWAQGSRYDAGLLWTSWNLLVQNHPHDSICGCSIDQVHREMITRFDWSEQIAEILAEKAARALDEGIDTTRLGDGDLALVAHNSLARRRTGWTSATVGQLDIDPRTHRLLDEEGNEVEFSARPAPGVQHGSDRWQHLRLGFVAKDVPALGYRAYRLTTRDVLRDPKRVSFSAVQRVAVLKGNERPTDLRVGGSVLENSFLRVEVNEADGTITVTDLITGRRYPGLNAFEDGGDAGDTYNYSQPLNDMVLRSDERARVHVSVAEAGHDRAALRIDLDWALPISLSDDRLSRSSSYVDTRMSTVVSLAAEARHAEIVTEWENLSGDHRLRALFPLGASPDSSHALGHFQVVRRAVGEPQGEGWPEPAVPTMPQQGWVSVESGDRGLTIAGRGLPEFEVLRDGEGTVALTLLRAVGWLSREDTLARVGGAGPEVPVPDAQSLGLNRVEYAIVPHTGDWLTSGSYEIAEDYLAPLYGSVTGAHAGDRGWSGGLLTLTDGEELVLSACKKADESDSLILRFWNITDRHVEAQLRFTADPVRVEYVDLKEESLAEDPVPRYPDGSYRLEAGPAAIVTLAVTL